MGDALRRMGRAALVVFALSPAVAAAQPAMGSARDLAEWLHRETGAPAAAVGILRAGQIDIAVAGIRVQGGAMPATPRDLWHIGSNTKSMTATLAARLVQAGRIAWDDSVAHHLPNLAGDAGWQDVTLADLLAHRGGLPANAGPVTMMRLRGTDDARDAVADRRIYTRRVLDRAPNRRAFVYSNAGYVVAGAMIEAATGESWDTLMRREVFQPLGMHSAGFGPPGASTDRTAPDQPWGHGGLIGHGPVAPGASADNPPALGPAGRVHLSVADHLTYLRAHLERPTDYLPPDAWDRLHADMWNQGYALGWAVIGERLVHTGSNTLWFHRVEIVPDRDLAFVLATNDGRVARMRPAMDSVAEAIRRQ